MRVSPSAAEVGDGGGSQSHPGEGSQDKTTLVVSPLRLPAAFCEDIRDVAMLEIAQNTFHYAHPVGQHQGQPMAVARFAVFESDAADHAAQARGRRGCPEHGGDVWPLV